MMSHIICTDGINCAVRTWPERQFPQAYEKNHRLRRAVSFSLPVLSQTFSPFLFCPCHIFSLFSSYRHLLLSLPRSAPFAFIRQQAFLPVFFSKLSLVRHRFDRSALPFLRSFFASLFLRRTAFLLLAPYSLSPFSFPFPALVTSLPPLLRPLLSALFSAHLHRPLFRLFRSLPVTQKT